MKKRMLSMLLAIVMVVGLLPGVSITASAAGETSGTIGNVNWSYNTDTKTLTISGTGEMGTDTPWKSEYESQIQTIVIASGVTRIGNSAFSSCSALTKVEIADTVTAIDAHAFNGCSILKHITIPASVTSIGAYAFSNCTALETVTYLGTSSPSGYGSSLNDPFYNVTNVMIIVPNDYTGTFCGRTVTKESEIPEEPDNLSLVYVGGVQLALNTNYINDNNSVKKSDNDTYNVKVTGNDSDGYTLTLRGANITGITDNTTNAYQSSGIISKLDELTIVVEEESTITGADSTNAHSAGIYSTGKITISGLGKLTIKGGNATGRNGVSSGILANELVIDNAKVDAIGGTTGEEGTPTSSGFGGAGDMSVTISGVNADVTATGNKYGAILKGNLTVSGGKFTAEAKSNTALYVSGTAILDSGEIIAQTVEGQTAINRSYATTVEGKTIRYTFADNTSTTVWDSNTVPKHSYIKLTVDNPDPIYHTITFITNGGKLTGDGITEVETNSKYTMQYEEGKGATLPRTITREGYVFVGWRDNSNLTGSNYGSLGTGANHNFTYYAKWDPTYTVTVVGGTGGGVYKEGTMVTITADAPEAGKMFAGWASEDGVIFADSKSAETTFTMPAKAVTVTANFEDIEYVTVNLESPRGLEDTITIDIESTVADLKAAVAEKCNVTFGSGSEYRLFGEDLSYPNSKLDDDTKVLSAIGFADGQTIHLEKSTNWDASGSEPIKIFGLTITGGKGSQEPYGDYNNVDYYWNYYYKTITIKSTANITISGTGEPNTNIIIKKAGSSSYTNLTIEDLHLTTDAGACIDVQGNSWVKLTVKGNNTLTATGENAPYTVDQVPALTLTNSGAYLKIMKASNGTLTATTNIAGQPGIGTYDNTSEVWGVEINGGTIIANGGAGAAGIRAQAVCIYGGNVTANGGIDGYGSNSLYPYSIEILGGTVTASSESGKVLSAAPNLDSYEYYTATASTSKDGTGAVSYDAAANDTYKYFKIEPRSVFTVSIDPAIVNGTVVADRGSSEKDGTVTLTVTPDAGYILDSLKYNNGSADTTITGNSFTMPAADVVVTAVFKPISYSIGYALDGGEASNPDTYTIETENFTLTNPTKTGYTFKGWSGTGLTGEENQTVTIAKGSTGDRTYTANWTANTYTVKFNANGGSGTMTDQGFTYDATQNLNANAFTYANKHFTGWNTVADGSGTAYTDGQNVSNLSTIDGDTVTLYAQWSDKPAQTIDFDTTARTATYGDGALDARTATAAGTITYSSSDETVATVDASGVVTVLKAGEVTITASAAETDGYAAGSASYKLTVAPKALTITVADKSVYVGSQKPDLSTAVAGKDYTISGFVDGDSITVALSYVTEPVMNKAGEYEITATASDGNYTITVVNGKLKVSYIPYTPSTPTTQKVTVPISGDEETIHVDAKVKGDTATIDHVDLDHLDTVIGDHVEEVGTVTIDFSVLDKPVTTVEIPANAVKEIADAVNDSHNDAHSFEVILTDDTSIEFDAEALAEKAAQADGKDITISIESHEDATLTSAQKYVVGDHVAFDINVTSGGEHISDMGGKISVHVPYELKQGEKASGIVVYYVDDFGNLERCETSYDPVKKRVNWKTDHLSLYMIDYDASLAESCDGVTNCPSKAFTDLDTSLWYHEATDYVLENGLMNGVGNDLFDPNGATSRAMIVTILWRLEGEPVVNYLMQFEDIPSDTWYTEAVRWAASEKIVEGYGDTFGPTDPITREQFATILWRYAKYKGYDVSVGEDTNILSYEDAFSVSEYAIPAMQWACGAGLMQGDGVNLTPKADATRAQAAALFQRFCENVAEK